MHGRFRSHLDPERFQQHVARAHRARRVFDPGRFGPGFPGGPFFGGGPGPMRGPVGRGRARRGDVRAAILALLAERQPMHGYEMIQELEGRTHGLWRPSPGSIYPTLQLLEDEGLVEPEEDGGKRSYRLTDAGREAAASAAEGPSPWEEVTAGADPEALVLRKSLGQLVVATGQVMRAGTPGQQEEADRILAEARRRIYGLLARED